MLSLQQSMGNRAVRCLVQRFRSADAEVLAAPRRSDTGLPETLKAGVERLSGLYLDDVDVHYNSAAPARLNVAAYAQGTDIHVAPGQEKHLPHEAWHVVQQMQGRVEPTMQLEDGTLVNDDKELERQADVMGRESQARPPTADKPHQSATQRASPAHSSVASVQAAGGHPKTRWSPEQREQSRKFWEKRRAREQRRAEGEAAREANMLKKERSATTEIVDSDERFFRNYLNEPKTPVTVYRGDGRGMNEHSLDNFKFEDVPPKPGMKDISFFGVVDHQHSNSTPGGMVSNTGDLDIGIGYATDKHRYGLVWEISIDDYIDVNDLLEKRNFRNRYPGQHEFLTPGMIPASKIVKVTLYKQPNEVVKVIEQ